MATISKSAIQAAIRAYRRGDRPLKFREPRSWYIETATGELLPLKYIYAMAKLAAPSSFNTSEAIREVQQLGYDLRHQPKDQHEPFEKKVSKALRNTAAARKMRLRLAPRKPALRLVESFAYDRNPDVVAEVLFQADGKCYLCKERAPFNRKKDGTPYLEVHHKTPLKNGGDDTVENAIAVCPNCHRKAHDQLSA